jgi:phage terminase large subunit-like protein
VYAQLSPKAKKALYVPPVSSGGDFFAINPLDYTKYQPQPGKSQQFFDLDDVDIVIFGGSAGSGKSLTLLLKALKGITTPGYTATIFRRFSPDITNDGGLWDKSIELYQDIPGGRSRESTQYLDWSFPGNSGISFGTADRLEQKYQGAELAFIGIDEIANGWTEKELLFLLSRNRSSCGVRPKIVGTCNPDSNSFLIRNEQTGEWGKNTLLEWYIDPDTGYPIPERSGVVRYFYRINDEYHWGDDPEELKSYFLEEITEPKSFTFISATIYDNPEFLKVNPGYLGNLLSQNTVQKERLFKGNWKISDEVGSVFNPAWFDVIDVAPPGYDFRFWDFAATAKAIAKKGSYYSASQKWRYCPMPGGDYLIVIMDVYWEQENPEINENNLLSLAKQDTRSTILGWEIEGGSAGIRYAESLSKLIRQGVPGVQIQPQKPLGDKVTRAKGWADKAKLGKIKVLRGSWNNQLFNALTKFDGTAKPLVNDVIDAGSGCNVLLELNHSRGRSKPLSGIPKRTALKR